MKPDYVVVLLLALSLTVSALLAYFMLSDDAETAAVTFAAPRA